MVEKSPKRKVREKRRSGYVNVVTVTRRFEEKRRGCKMINFRKIEEGEPLIFRDRRNNEVYTENVKFAGFAETGHPVVEFENGKRLMVLPEQLAYPQEEEFVNIRIYRSDRDRLAVNMKYGETMADAIRALIKKIGIENLS